MAIRYLASLFIIAFFQQCTTKSASDESSSALELPKGENKNAPEDMVWIPGGEFTMGSETQSGTGDILPLHQVKVDGFWIDQTEVTNDQFSTFVKATGYITVAERPVEWEEMMKQLPPGTPKPSDDLLKPGSLVFVPPTAPVMLNDYSQWWTWVQGADWKHPQGPGSSIEGLGKHPVVHIAYEDAQTYATWAGKRLPTEAEYEFASRGGLNGKAFAWGDELNPQGKYLANYFQGSFPNSNSGDDGFVGTAPVKSYPPNGYGLYDMIGNVWELCSDWYAVDRTLGTSQITLVNPKGPAASKDPNDPFAIKHVSKGGSFLCANQYCSNYTPSGRQGSAFDSGMSHTGFRCVKSK